MYAKKNSSKKLLVVLLVLMLLLGCTIGGTLAWLVTHTDPMINTFVVGKIELELKETFNAKSSEAQAVQNSDNDIWVGRMVPGMYLSKDPHVVVKAGSEKCWLFVKIDTAGGGVEVQVNEETHTTEFGDYIHYEVADGWTKVNGYDSVYVKSFGTGESITYEVNAEAEQTFYILKNVSDKDEMKNGSVKILDTVTQEMLTFENNADLPTLTFTAYAIQSEYLTKTTEVDGKATEEAVITPAQAWEQILGQMATDAADNN